MIGETLGQYRIESRLGSGGMGVVYRAHDERLHRSVALKLISAEGRGSTPDERARLLDEARAASHLTHPHICTVYEVGELDGRVFIAMEFVDGRPLSQLVPADGLPAETVVRYGEQIAAALAHAHERGVIHRDLKTANVAVGAGGAAKILDFGLAHRTTTRAAEETTQANAMADPGVLIGTLAYVAPEVLLGHGADARTDIWALGVVLYELATGQLPFQGRSEYDLTAAILRSPALPFPAHVPPILCAIILRCLAKEPAQRYQRAGEVRAALEAIHSDLVVAPPVDSLATRPRSAWIGATGAVGIVGVALATWLLMRHEDPREAAPSGGRLTRVASSQDRTFDPAISPDGRMLAYVAEGPPGQIDLYAGRVSGGARIRLTDDLAREEWPRFSPDGESIAFTVTDAGGGPPAIKILPALGGAALATIPGAADAAWAPDGRRLTYIRRRPDGKGNELAVSSTDGSDARAVLPADSRYPFLRHPAWSPDQRTIAIVRGTGGAAGEVWLVPSGGGSARAALHEPETVFSDWPTFTSDGRALVHASNRGGATNIWRLPLSGGSPVQLTTGAGPDESPSLGRDGTIAYVNSRWQNTLEIHDLTNGSSRTLVTHTPYVWAPAVSPDGSEIAFSRSEVDGSWHIWTIGLSGGPARQLTSGEAGEVYPRYARDGLSLFFHTWNAPRRVGRVPPGGGPAAWPSLGGNGGTATFGDPSPDGKLLAFVRADSDAERIYIASTGNGAARRLTASRGTLPRWSPDGSTIAFASDRRYDGGIFVIHADGSGERQLTKDGGWPVWWPDGSQIGYIAVGANGNGEIRTVSLRDGTARRLESVRLATLNHPFALFPDGVRLVVGNAVHMSDEIWVIEPRR
jgi:serine/threonine protein kinase/Tol biopolymer transport system component